MSSSIVSSIALVRAQVAHRLAGRSSSAVLGFQTRPELPLLRTGIDRIDQEFGGLPLGAITEICANPAHSTGTTSLLMSLLKTTTQENFCALIDCNDALNVRWAEHTGVRLDHLLWVRCQEPVRKQRFLSRIDQALKATDLLLKANCGFALIIVDLEDAQANLLRRIPLDVWYRFRLAAQNLKAALVICTPVSVTGTCSNLVLQLEARKAAWCGSDDEAPAHSKVFESLSVHVEARRARELKKNIQGVRLHFTSTRKLG